MKYQVFLFVLITVGGFLPFVSFGEDLAATRKKAEQGNAIAQYNLGIAHAQGEGVPQNYKESAMWFRLAAEQGLSDAQFNLSYAYFKGQGVPQDYKEAVKWLRKAAEQGEVDALYSLAGCYLEGNGVPQDYEEAVKWLRKAAEQGSVYAYHTLGVCYARGQGVTKNYREAVRWAHKAAEQGMASSQILLGVCFSSGRDIPKDYVQAYAWCSLAVAQRAETADALLRSIEGKMTPEQIAKGKRLAKEYSDQIARNGSIPISLPSELTSNHEGLNDQLNVLHDIDVNKLVKIIVPAAIIAILFGINRRKQKPLKQMPNSKLLQAAQRNDVKAQAEMGRRYYSGTGVPKDYAESVRWFRLAAENGHAAAQYHLALSYELGQGVLQDNVQAAAWYSLSATQGEAQAGERMLRLLTKMTPEQITEGKNLAAEYAVKFVK